MRIFVDPQRLAAGALEIAGDEHHYLSRVRRARVGDVVELVDGAGRRASARIAAIADASTSLEVEAPSAVPPAVPFIRALIPWIKGYRMDLCIEKLVEAGCDEIAIYPAARAVVKLEGERLNARVAKLQAAAQAAARQCGRAQVPAVVAVPALTGSGACIVLDPTSEAPLDVADAKEVTLASGPEGGFAPAELEALSAWTSAGLGPRILRAETAPVLATAIIRAQTRS